MIILRHTMKITLKFIPTSCNFVNEKFLIIHKSIVDIALMPHHPILSCLSTHWTWKLWSLSTSTLLFMTTISHCLALSLVPESALLPCHFSYPHMLSSSYQNDRNSDDAPTHVQFLASFTIFGWSSFDEMILKHGCGSPIQFFEG